MLRSVLTYLWKEWRDNRAIVIGLALAIPLLLAICKWALPAEIVNRHIFPPVTALSVYLIALFSLGSDLIPGEARRDRLGFLCRLPADLTVPFLAKALFLGAMLTAFTWYGFGLACLFGEVPAKTKPELALLMKLAFCTAPWVFAISAWLPRGALAVPAAALALGLFGLPFYLILLRSFGPVIGYRDLMAFGYLLAGWSLVVAWFSWAKGRRLGRGIGSAAWRGALVALVLFVPAWGYVGRSAHEWKQIDPFAKDFRITNGVLSANGRQVYLNCQKFRGPNHVIHVDLETGAWERLGSVRERVVPVEPLRTVVMGNTARWLPARSPLVAIQVMGSLTRVPPQHFRYWARYLDADTATRVRSGWQGLDFPEVKARFGKEWHDLEKDTFASSFDGLGAHVITRSGTRIYDPFRRKLFPRSRYRVYSIKVRPGPWLARRAGRDWQLLDPESGAMRPSRLPALHIQLLPDGRVLCNEPRTGRILVADPETGETEPLAISGVAYVDRPTLGGGVVIRYFRNKRQIIARLDLDTLEVSNYPLPETARVIGPFDDDSLLAISNDRLVRAWPGKQEVKLLWPIRE